MRIFSIFKLLHGDECNKLLVAIELHCDCVNWHENYAEPTQYSRQHNQANQTAKYHARTSQFDNQNYMYSRSQYIKQLDC
mgnify:CR=1 FL=1